MTAKDSRDNQHTKNIPSQPMLRIWRHTVVVDLALPSIQCKPANEARQLPILLYSDVVLSFPKK